MVTKFFSIGKISQKKKKLKIENEMIVEISSCQKWTKKIWNLEISRLSTCNQKYERIIFFFFSYMVYNYIWLKFFGDDHHFGYKQKILKKHEDGNHSTMGIMS